MDRFLTKFSVALNYTDAIKLAIADGTPYRDIVITNNVLPIHIKKSSSTDLCSWVWWSDSRLTTANGLPTGLRAKQLSVDAVKLITLALEGNTFDRPTCNWQKLADIKKIISIKQIAVNAKKYDYNKIFISIIKNKSNQDDFINLITISGSQRDMPFCQFYEVSPEELESLLFASSDINVEKLLKNIGKTNCFVPSNNLAIC